MESINSLFVKIGAPEIGKTYHEKMKKNAVEKREAVSQ
jgi:hypothetical protein